MSDNRIIALSCDICDEQVDEWKMCETCPHVVCWDCVSWCAKEHDEADGAWMCDECKKEHQESAQKSEPTGNSG